MILRILKCIFIFIILEFLFIFIGGLPFILFDKENLDFVLISYIGYPVFIGLIWIILGLTDKTLLKEILQLLTINSFRLRQALLFFLFSIGLFIIVVVPWLVLIPHPYFQGIYSNVNFLNILIITFLVSTTEEILYRGVLFSYFKRNIGVKLSIIVLSVLFSLLHFSYSNIISYFTAFFMSVFSFYLVISTRSLVPSICFHAGWNFIYTQMETAGFLNYISVKENYWLEIFQLLVFLFLFAFAFRVIKNPENSSKLPSEF